MGSGASEAGRQFGSNEIAQHPCETRLGEIAQERPDGHCENRQESQFDDGNGQHEGLRGSHALHQSHGVDVPRRIASGAHRHRHGGEQHGCEAGQIEKPAGPIDGGIQLTARFVDLAQTFARCLGRDDVFAECGYRRRGAGEQGGVGHAAAGLNQSSRCHVIVVDQRRRREIHEARALIRPVVEHLSHFEGGGAYPQRRSQRYFQLSDDARVDPHFAAAGDAIGGARGTEGRVGDADAPAQRVAGRHRVERRQLTRIAAEYRGREAQDSRAAQSPGLRLGEIARRDGVGRFQTQIRGQHFGRLRAYALRDAAGEEADGGQGKDRHRQRQQQH